MAHSERLVLSATCDKHGTREYTNLAIEPDGDAIRLDPHVMGVCTVTLGREEVRKLVTRLSEWL